MLFRSHNRAAAREACGSEASRALDCRRAEGRRSFACACRTPICRSTDERAFLAGCDACGAAPFLNGKRVIIDEAAEADGGGCVLAPAPP